MRTRERIEGDGRVKLDLVIEVLLDIRDLLSKKASKAEPEPVKAKVVKPRGRPKGTGKIRVRRDKKDGN